MKRRTVYLATALVSGLTFGCGGGGGDHYTGKDIRFAAGWVAPVDVDLFVRGNSGASCTFTSCPIGQHSADNRGNDGADAHAEGAWVQPTEKDEEPYTVYLHNYGSYSVEVEVLAVFGSNTSDYKIDNVFVVPAGSTVAAAEYRSGRFSAIRGRSPSREGTGAPSEALKRVVERD